MQLPGLRQWGDVLHKTKTYKIKAEFDETKSYKIEAANGKSYKIEAADETKEQKASPEIIEWPTAASSYRMCRVLPALATLNKDELLEIAERFSLATSLVESQSVEQIRTTLYDYDAFLFRRSWQVGSASDWSPEERALWGDHRLFTYGQTSLIMFGEKHKGKTYQETLETDPAYCECIADLEVHGYGYQKGKNPGMKLFKDWLLLAKRIMDSPGPRSVEGSCPPPAMPSETTGTCPAGATGTTTWDSNGEETIVSLTKYAEMMQKCLGSCLQHMARHPLVNPTSGPIFNEAFKHAALLTHLGARPDTEERLAEVQRWMASDAPTQVLLVETLHRGKAFPACPTSIIGRDFKVGSPGASQCWWSAGSPQPNSQVSGP